MQNTPSVGHRHQGGLNKFVVLELAATVFENPVRDIFWSTLNAWNCPPSLSADQRYLRATCPIDGGHQKLVVTLEHQDRERVGKWCCNSWPSCGKGSDYFGLVQRFMRHEEGRDVDFEEVLVRVLDVLASIPGARIDDELRVVLERARRRVGQKQIAAGVPAKPAPPVPIINQVEAALPLEDQILHLLTRAPASGRLVAETVRRRRADVLKVLRQLQASGRIQLRYDLPDRNGRRQPWGTWSLV